MNFSYEAPNLLVDNKNDVRNETYVVFWPKKKKIVICLMHFSKYKRTTSYHYLPELFFELLSFFAKSSINESVSDNSAEKN